MSINVTHVSSVGHRGPRATRVSFGPVLPDGSRPWAWIPNEVAEEVRPGTAVVAEEVRLFGKVESTYVDKLTGETVTKRVPTQQVVFGGNVVFDAPEDKMGEPATFVVSDQAKAYAAARLAASGATFDGDPFAS